MKHKLYRSGRILLLACTAALTIVLFVPLWRIDLSAPQYPEGLRLLIYPNKLGGNVDIINGLNHYIGMKTLHTADFVEFSVLPYIIAFFALLFLISALLNKRILLYISFTLFICFAVLAMIDFWKWEYNYGHNLNPDAAIVVPGMAYQPPLIGYKQLLNFSAYSFPDTGGWLFVAVGIILLLICVKEWLRVRKFRRNAMPSVNFIIPAILIMGLSSCSAGPEPIISGRDHCDDCGMTISDDRFGAELVTKKGKVYKFDDIHCLVSFTEKNKMAQANIKEFYLTDFAGKHTLVKAADVLLLRSTQLKSPMTGNTAAFQSRDSLDKIKEIYGGELLKWNDLYQP